jgi:hypothetical protein
MDAASVEAMHSEAHLITKKFRTLFKHLRFFGTSQFESEMK